MHDSQSFVSRYYRLTRLLILGIALSMASCELEDQEIPTEELYLRSFIKSYGIFDSTHTWNMAENKSVNVSVTGTAAVKVMAWYQGSYAIVANYPTFTGSKQIYFDCPSEVTDLLVIADSSSKKCKVGESVSFTGSRTMIETGAYTNIFSVAADYTTLNLDLIKDYINLVPEDGDNVGKVTCNFSLLSQGAFSFFPVYWWSSSNHVLGVYWSDSDGYHEQDIYHDMEGNELQIYQADGWVSAGINLPYLTYSQIRAKAITINLPAGTVFGFYIKVYDSSGNYNHIIYSEADKNTKTLSSDTESLHKYASTSTVTSGSESATFFGFEDWGEGHIDLNDVIFMFADKISPGDPPITIDIDNSISWILAAEDLGDTDDFDFNDVVVQIEHVSGQNPTLTALAAGGTLPVQLQYYGQTIKSSDDKEQFHHWFQGDPATGTMINTTSGPTEFRSKAAVELDVETLSNSAVTKDDFSLANWGGYSNDMISGFSILVERSDGQFSTISRPGAGEAPQMFIVPSGWAWPKERNDIKDCYPKFADWISDPKVTEWWKVEYVTDNLIRTPYFGTTTSSGGGEEGGGEEGGGEEGGGEEGGGGGTGESTSKITVTQMADQTPSWGGTTLYPVYKLVFSSTDWESSTGIEITTTNNSSNFDFYSDSACTNKLGETIYSSKIEKANFTLPDAVEGSYTIYLLDYTRNFSSANLY